MGATPVVGFGEEQVDRLGRRVGYFVAFVLTLGLMWVANRLLVWEWPSWLTEDFAEVLPILNLSLGTSALVYLVWIAWDSPLVKLACDLITLTLSIAVGIAMWNVFPFDFSSYEFDWAALTRWVIAVSLLLSGIGWVAKLVQLVTAAVFGRSGPGAVGSVGAVPTESLEESHR